MSPTRRILFAAVSLLATGSLPAAEQAVTLKAGPLTATLQVPESWGAGKPFTEATAENDGINLRLPQGPNVYSGRIWTGLTPKWVGPDAAPGGPQLTIALVAVPARFTDDEGSRLPENDRPERSLTSEQKEAVFAPLAKVFADSGVDVAQFRTKDGQPAKEFTGAWWGNDGFGTQNILDAQFLENADKSLRGILYLYTEASDLSFFVLARILLYNPKSRALLLMDLPLGTFPEAQALENAITDESKKDPDAYAKAVAFYRDRQSWADTPMGRVLTAMETVARSTKLD